MIKTLCQFPFAVPKLINHSLKFHATWYMFYREMYKYSWRFDSQKPSCYKKYKVLAKLVVAYYRHNCYYSASHNSNPITKLQSSPHDRWVSAGSYLNIFPTCIFHPVVFPISPYVNTGQLTFYCIMAISRYLIWANEMACFGSCDWY